MQAKDSSTTLPSATNGQLTRPRQSLQAESASISTFDTMNAVPRSIWSIPDEILLEILRHNIEPPTETAYKTRNYQLKYYARVCKGWSKVAQLELNHHVVIRTKRQACAWLLELRANRRLGINTHSLTIGLSYNDPNAADREPDLEELPTTSPADPSLVLSILVCVPSLKRLTMNRCGKVDLGEISIAADLRYLKLNLCDLVVQPEYFRQKWWVTKWRLPRLEHLEFSFCDIELDTRAMGLEKNVQRPAIQDELWLSILNPGSLPRLSSLYVNASIDLDMLDLSQIAEQLEVLWYSRAFSVGHHHHGILYDSDLPAALSRCKNLKHLALHIAGGDAIISELSNLYRSLQRCGPSLRTLRIDAQWSEMERIEQMLLHDREAQGDALITVAEALSIVLLPRLPSLPSDLGDHTSALQRHHRTAAQGHEIRQLWEARKRIRQKTIMSLTNQNVTVSEFTPRKRWSFERNEYCRVDPGMRRWLKLVEDREREN